MRVLALLVPFLLCAAGVQAQQAARDSLDQRASYVQGSVAATITYLERALEALAAGDTAAVGSAVRQARGRVRAMASHVIVLRSMIRGDRPTPVEPGPADSIPGPQPDPEPEPEPEPEPVEPDTIDDDDFPPAPAPVVIGAPELPRHYVDPAMPTATGRVIQVAQGDDLQGALNSAQPGDIVEIDAGATFIGTFRLNPKPSEGWVIVRTSRYAELPGEGQRVAPADSALMPNLLGGRQNKPAIIAMPGATGWRLVGLEVAFAPSDVPPLVGNLVDLSYGSSHVILDRMYIHGRQRTGVQRCVVLNNSWSAVINSWLDRCHAKGFDSQAILGWKGPGPFLIENNYLAGAGENIMFGGVPIGSGETPADVVIRRNHIHKPLSWRGEGWTVKNLVEFKMVQRVLVEGNVMENNWPNAQNGFGVVIKSENRDKNRLPDNAVTDVIWRNNRLVNSKHGYSLTGGASTERVTGRGRTSRLYFENNSIEDTEQGHRAVQASGVIGLTFHKNEFPGVFFITNTRHPVHGLVLSHNIMRSIRNASGGQREGTGTLEAGAPGYVFSENILVGQRADWYPKNATHMTNAEANAYDGPIGLDEKALAEATAGVVVGAVSP